MKLLFVTEKFPPQIGGVAKSAERISRTIAGLGHEVHVVSICQHLPAGAVRTESTEDRLHVHQMGAFKNVDFTLQQCLNFLEWLHEGQKFDAVWAHFLGAAGFLATWFAQHNGLRSLLSLRGNDLDRQLFPPGDMGRLRWSLENGDRIVTVSEDLARKVATLVKREAIVLPNVVDAEQFQPGPKPEDLLAAYQIRPEEIVLGFSGELRAKKGLTFLLRAYGAIVKRQPARLLIIGEVRSKDRGEYERTLAELRIPADGIICTGHLEDARDVARHLRLADVFLLPSLWEGMPNSLLEAMACGVGVIASDAGAIPEVVQHGATGMILAKTHLHLLADRVEEWLAMPGDRRSAITSAARESICKQHSPERERQMLEELLADLAVNQ